MREFPHYPSDGRPPLGVENLSNTPECDIAVQREQLVYHCLNYIIEKKTWGPLKGHLDLLEW